MNPSNHREPALLKSQASGLKPLPVPTSHFRLPTWPSSLSAFVCAAVLLCAAPSPGAEPGAPGDLYVQGPGGGVYQFDGPTGAAVGLFGDAAGTEGLTFGPNGNLFVAYDVYNVGGGVREFDGQTGALVGVFVAPGSGGLDNPFGVTFGPNGNLFVASYATDEVIEFDGATGSFVRSLSGGGLASPTGLTFGPNGNLFVSSNPLPSPAVIEFDAGTGVPVGVFASGGGLDHPWGLAFGPSGNLFVTSYDEVLEYDGATGAFLGVFASGGSFFGMKDLAFGSNGNLYVTFRNYDVIVEYDGATGAWLREFAHLESPEWLTFKPCPSIAPQIAGLVPTQADDCGRLWDATVTGSGLWPSCMATLALTKPGEPDIVGSIVGGSTDVQIIAHFDLDGAAAGPWALTAVNAAGQSDSLPGALGITSPTCPPPVITGFSSGFGEDLAYSCRELEGAIIAGADLEPAATIVLRSPGGLEIAGTDVEVQSPGTVMVADFDLTDVPPGTWDVEITNPDGQNATWPMQIEACPIGRVGDLYVCNSLRDNVLQFDTDGNFVCEFVERDSGRRTRPTDLTWGPNGNLFVCGPVILDPPVQGAVWEYDGATGAFIRDFVPTGGGGLAGPTGLAFGGADGNLYVVNEDSSGGHHINVYDRTSGAFVRTFDLGEVDQNMPRFDASGALFISDETGDPTKPLLEQWDPIAGVKVADLISPEPTDGGTDIWGFIRMPDGGHWLVTYLNGALHSQIRTYDGATGALLDILVDFGPSVPFGLFTPVDLAYGPDGNLFVSSLITYIPDIAKFRGAIHKYDGDTFEALSVFGFQTPGPVRDDELWKPRGLEFKPLPGDFGGELSGGDWDVDADDLVELAARFTGPGVQTVDAHALVAFDSDRDGDLDLADYAAFQRAFGTSLQATGACCWADGTCTDDVWKPECAGFYLGDATTCGVDPCPGFGACCDGAADGTCSDDLTESQCLAMGDSYQGDATTCGLVTCPFGRYSNEIDPMTSVALAGAGLQIADDMTLEGTGARDLVFLDLRVFGNGGGAFDVTVELWTDCPGNGGSVIPNTTFDWVGVPDDGNVYILTVDPLSPAVTIPDTVWMTATFSTPESGWIIAEQAETGTTADLYGRNNPWTCNATFTSNHAGLWANLRCVAGSSKAGGDRVGETQLHIERMEPAAALRIANGE